MQFLRWQSGWLVGWRIVLVHSPLDPSQSLPEHITILSRNVRRRIFEALKDYYREELHLDNYSVRLGNLITFEHTIQVSGKKCQAETWSFTGNSEHFGRVNAAFECIWNAKGRCFFSRRIYENFIQSVFLKPCHGRGGASNFEKKKN